ncbi:MAG TPA: hypothetical protein VMW16_08715 [Sedimentisphaerales bacterium]|nr:hypothetical protein [Sedimentisphaerales bacterium]
MKIEIVNDYRGPLGTFKPGETYDFPKKVVQRLPKLCYKEVLPPEDADAVVYELGRKASVPKTDLAQEPTSNTLRKPGR